MVVFLFAVLLFRGRGYRSDGNAAWKSQPDRPDAEVTTIRKTSRFSVALAAESPLPPSLSLSRSLSFSLFFFRCAARFCLNKAGRAIQLPFSVPFRTFNYLFRFNGVKLDRKHAAALAVPPRFSASSLRQVNAIIINGML
jgi:hypothetical protein